ncbi:putative photosystem II [Dioscorea sansibarensis]
MHPWIAITYSVYVAVASIIFLIYQISHESLSHGMPLGFSGTFIFTIAFLA